MITSSNRFNRAFQWLRNSDSLAVLALLGLLGLFYPELFLVRAAPLIGDSLEQHYPWAYQLAQSLKSFKLPFWTPLIQCGFPLVAESQVGAFYIPNLLFFGLLPFHVAYSYMNLFHWFIAGWGTYAYSKQMKLGVMASFVAAVIFVFGGAYGGAYYNMTSLKTICWFPVALYLLEQYLCRRQKRFLAGMALVIGQSLVAGYLQMAVLTWMIFGVYVGTRIFVFPEVLLSWRQSVWTLGVLTVAAVGALLLAFPQIFLTFQMALLSNRTGLEEGYAYVGSMSPAVLGTMVIPKLSLMLRGNDLYAGAFSLFLVLFAFSSPEIRKSRTFRLWSVMTLISLLLALGRWSPLYVALIKLTKFYSFRFPAKFVGFICFGFAMMSAVGFQALWQGRSTQAVVRKALWAYLAIVSFSVSLMFFAKLLMTSGKDIALKLGEYFVMRFVYAKPGHPHSLESYLDIVKSYPDYVLNYISLRDPANIWMVVMSCFCVVLVIAFQRKKLVARSLLCVGIFFLAVDLYAASFLDIQLDLAPYKQVLTSSPLLNVLEAERAVGRLGKIYGFRSAKKQLPFAPSQNILYGFADIGAYSPLVSKRYNESIGLLGNVNDSNFQRFPSLDFVLQRLPLLGFLDVSHVLSTEPIDHADLQLLSASPARGRYLYRNLASHQSAYFIGKVKIVQDWDALRAELMAPHFDPKEILLLEKEELPQIGLLYPPDPTKPGAVIILQKQEADFEEWRVESAQAGFFVVPESFYPGWEASVNGKAVAILKADGLFRAIRLDEPGTYRIQFRYRPFRGIPA